MPPSAKPTASAGGMVWDGVASFNAFTVNWEAKDKVAEAAVTDDIDMYVEGNLKTGKDKVCVSRVLPNAPTASCSGPICMTRGTLIRTMPTLCTRATTYLRSCNQTSIRRTKALQGFAQGGQPVSAGEDVQVRSELRVRTCTRKSIRAVDQLDPGRRPQKVWDGVASFNAFTVNWRLKTR